MGGCFKKPTPCIPPLSKSTKHGNLSRLLQNPISSKSPDQVSSNRPLASTPKKNKTNAAASESATRIAAAACSQLLLVNLQCTDATLRCITCYGIMLTWLVRG